MTCRAGGLSIEQRFARRHIALGYHCAARRLRRGASILERADVADELPHLLVAKPFVRRHLRARHALAYRAEEVGVAIAVLQSSCVQRGAAAAGIADARGAVARLARSVENTLSVDRRRRVVRERIHDGIRHRRLLCEKHTGSHGRNRTCDEFDSVVHSERNYTPWLEHPRP